jgi:uncharacterized protein YoxC
MNDRALTYLQADSYGQKRDLIARCYYQVAQGDPDSGPVAFAVLIRASAEQLDKIPEELADITTSFQKVVNDAADIERRMIERVDRNNAAVVAGFQDETRRATDTLRDIIAHSHIIVERVKQIDQTLKPLAVSLERIADKVYLLNENLRQNHESATKTAAAADKIHNVYETTLEPVNRLTHDVRFLLVSGGFLGGMLFDQLCNQTELLPWTGLVALFLILGWIQYLFRKSWKGARWLAQKWKSYFDSDFASLF